MVYKIPHAPEALFKYYNFSNYREAADYQEYIPTGFRLIEGGLEHHYLITGSWIEQSNGIWRLIVEYKTGLAMKTGGQWRKQSFLQRLFNPLT